MLFNAAIYAGMPGTFQLRAFLKCGSHIFLAFLRLTRWNYDVDDARNRTSNLLDQRRFASAVVANNDMAPRRGRCYGIRNCFPSFRAFEQVGRSRDATVFNTAYIVLADELGTAPPADRRFSMGHCSLTTYPLTDNSKSDM
jgi:hypothetical protein